LEWQTHSFGDIANIHCHILYGLALLFSRPGELLIFIKSYGCANMTMNVRDVTERMCLSFQIKILFVWCVYRFRNVVRVQKKRFYVAIQFHNSAELRIPPFPQIIVYSLSINAFYIRSSNSKLLWSYPVKPVLDIQGTNTVEPGVLVHFIWNDKHIRSVTSRTFIVIFAHPYDFMKIKSSPGLENKSARP
jgi:hypothetical protein